MGPFLHRSVYIKAGYLTQGVWLLMRLKRGMLCFSSLTPPAEIIVSQKGLNREKFVKQKEK